jgi:hypothetical protein
MKKILGSFIAVLALFSVCCTPEGRDKTLNEETASVTVRRNIWTLRNESVEMAVSFVDGKLFIDGLRNPAAKVDYLHWSASVPLFTHQLDGVTIAADDGEWKLDSAVTKDIELYGRHWGKRLEITISRTNPVKFCTRQVFEIYNGRAAIRYLSLVKNGTDKEVTINASDVFDLKLPDRPHMLYFIEGRTSWNSSREGLIRGGRNCIVRYDDGHGVFVIPENNWATSLEPGGFKGLPDEKLLYINAWQKGEKTEGPNLSVSTNPKAVRLVLFPYEEVEYFSVDFGIFTGDALDGRVAIAEHLRKRFKFHDPSHQLSTNDWIWYNKEGRTDAKYRNIVIPKAAAAGFDRIHFDDFWYAPQDSCEPNDNWTDMQSLCSLIISNGMKPGHWFSLQGRYCYYGWGEGRDCADPANVDFKLKQMEEVLIGKYQTSWDQIDAGLLWKNDKETDYSHPSDAVYRKILGMQRYMNTIAHKYPDFMMQVTCEIDNTVQENPQNVGLIHLSDNGIIGMFRRTDTQDDVLDLFDCVGQFPLEGMLSTWGENGSPNAWKDSPLWYYQFLLARHTTIYSMPESWSTESINHLREFNDWRKNPRFKTILNEVMRPVYNGKDWQKNLGPWVWMFTDERKTKALLFAINHLNMSNENPLTARLRWLDSDRTYLVEDITMLPGGKFNHLFRGTFSGAQLKESGLSIDLNTGPERCAAFWIKEKVTDSPQVLYADAAVTNYKEKIEGTNLKVMIEGSPKARAMLIVFKPGKNGVENREVTLDASGKATMLFDFSTISQMAEPIQKGGN